MTDTASQLSLADHIAFPVILCLGPSEVIIFLSMRRALVALFLAVASIVGVFIFSNLRPHAFHAVSDACRQDRLQGIPCPPGEYADHRDSSLS